MSSRYQVYFCEKSTYLILADRFSERPVGQLVFSFLDVDWHKLSEAAVTARRNAFTMAQTQIAFDALRQSVAGLHPFFAIAMNHLEIKPDALYAVYQWAGDMAHFSKQFSSLVSRVLSCDESEAAPPLERYAEALRTDASLVRLAARMHESASLQFPILPAADGADVCLRAKLCISSCNLQSVVFLEFEHMVSENCGIRSCAHCGHYFLPFSTLARYCDRVQADGKSCKEHAPYEKYQARLHENRAKALYVKNANAYQMRLRRAPDLYPEEELLAWRKRAKTAMNAYERGEMDFETFAEIVALPKRSKRKKV